MRAIVLRPVGGALLLLLSACGGGSGGSGPAPEITSISPTSVTAGGPSFVLTVMGNNFPADAVLTWNGTILTTQTISSDELQAQVGQLSITTGGKVTIAVAGPHPGSATSASVTLTVNNPTPTVVSLSRYSMPVGGGSFTLNVNGSGFTGTSVVDWNGSPRATSYLDSTLITASIDAADVASMQTASITVVNALPGGGQSGVVYFPVYLLLSQTANDIAWDDTNQVLYASVPSGASSHANTVLTLDPNTGSVLSSQPAGAGPDTLALSVGDGYLYVGEDTSSAIQRFTLPGLTPDISWSLGSGTFGPYYALDMQVAPGAPHTIAVSLGNNSVSPTAQGGIVIYDDSTARATTAAGDSGTGHLYDSLQWGSTDSVLFGANNETSGADFYILSVDSSGVTLGSDVPGRVSVFQNQAIHYDAGTGDIYGDGGGIFDRTGAVLGVFKPTQTLPGALAVDSAINRVFMVTAAGGGSWGFDIQSFDKATQQPISSIEVAGINLLTTSKIVRWGTDGLALLVNNGFVRTGQIMLIKGPFIH